MGIHGSSEVDLEDKGLEHLYMVLPFLVMPTGALFQGVYGWKMIDMLTKTFPPYPAPADWVAE